jgi:ABC-type transport system substrate-binding protein
VLRGHPRTLPQETEAKEELSIMSKGQNYWLRKAQGSHISRRRFVGGAALAGAGAAGLALVGCGDDDDNGQATPTSGAPAATPGTTATPAAAQRTPGGVSRGVFLGALDFDNVDLHRVRANPTLWMSNSVLNKVLRHKNPDTGEIEGDLAESWEPVDAANYVFKIRKDVKWQNTPVTNGRQFTAEDIQWHWQRQIDGKLLDGSTGDFARASLYRQIVKIEVPDQYTIRVTLEKPNATFLDSLSSFTAAVPNREATEKFGEGAPKTRTEEAMPATGAYILKQWRPDKEVLFQKNPNNFRKGEPLLDGFIVPLLFGDPAAHRIAFEQKQVDSWAGPDNTTTKAVIDAHRAQMWESMTGVANTVYLNLNMNQQFKDVRLVRAVNLAFDRRALIQSLHQGLGQVSGPVTWLQEGFAVPTRDLIEMDGYRVNRDDDNKKARELWSAANGASLGEINIATIQDWSNIFPDTITILPDMLNKALGVNQFVSRRATYEDVTANLANGTFPNWFAWTSAVSGPDPRQGLRSTYHSTSTTNYQKVKNSDLDALLDKAIQETDYQKSVDLVRQAQKILIENASFGNINAYNYIYRTAGWNYFHPLFKVEPAEGRPAEGYNIFAGHLTPGATWLDTKDPTFQGRPAATV